LLRGSLQPILASDKVWLDLLDSSAYGLQLLFPLCPMWDVPPLSPASLLFSMCCWACLFSIVIVASIGGLFLWYCCWVFLTYALSMSIFFIACSTPLLHVLLRLPLLLCPCGFHWRTLLVILLLGFLNVCPIHVHLLYRLLHSSSVLLSLCLFSFIFVASIGGLFLWYCWWVFLTYALSMSVFFSVRFLLILVLLLYINADFSCYLTMLSQGSFWETCL